MYLPQPSLGFDLYTEALEAVHNLVEQVPSNLRPFNIMVGCDANCPVRNHEELDMLVVPLTHPTRWIDGDASRIRVFVDFILRLGLRVSNTFPAADVELPGSTACWTHSWYVDLSVTKQIDFVFFRTSDCISESRVMYDLNRCSDHKPLACKAILKLAGPVTKTAGRVRKKIRSVKGWRPRSQADVAEFANAMSELPPDATVTQILEHLSNTVLEVPHTTPGLHNKISVFSDPDAGKS